ncbi:MAG: AsmA family protein [bacterium]
MKKALKWFGIILGSLIGLIILAAVLLPFFLPLDKIKDMATEKISETINREVKIKTISFNLFEGIKLGGISISNREGFAKKDFVSADSIVLRYALWPIFQRQIIVKEISLVKPEILVEKSAAGVMNFSDLTKKKKKKGKIKENQGESGKESFSLFVDSFSIKNARITYADYGTNQTSEIKNADLKISGITLSGLKPIGLKASATAVYKEKEIPLSLAGKVNLKLAEEKLNIPALVLKIAGEQATIATTVSRWKAGPDVDFTISSKKLSADPLLAIFASEKPKVKKKKAEPGVLTAKIDKLTKSIKPQYRIKAKIDIDNLTLLDFLVDKVDVELSLENKQASLNLKEIAFYEGKLSGLANVNLAQSGLAYQIKDLRLEEFNATPFTNSVVDSFLAEKMENSADLKDKVYGKLSMALSLQGSGVESQDIMRNAIAEGSFNLTNGEIKRMKILAKVGETIKSNSLKEDMKFQDLAANFTMKNRVITTKDLKVGNSDLAVIFNGGADLGGLAWVAGNRLQLKLSPDASKGLSKEFDLMRDDQGWFELTFELTGSLKMPIPKPILDKPIEKVIGKIKAKIEAKTIEIEQAAQAEITKAEEEAKQKLEEEKQRLAEEAKQKVAEEAKKQLKNLIKF